MLFSAYECKSCGKGYSKRDSLRVHLAYYCGKESKFACPEVNCSYKTKLLSNLKRHTKVHEKTICYENNGTGGNVQNHMYNNCHQ